MEYEIVMEERMTLNSAEIDAFMSLVGETTRKQKMGFRVSESDSNLLDEVYFEVCDLRRQNNIETT